MTTTIEEIRVDTESIFELDFTYAPECEWESIGNGSECDAAAEFKMVLSCCAEVWLVCEDHMYRILAFVRESVNPHHNPDDGGCGNPLKSFALIERL